MRLTKTIIDKANYEGNQYKGGSFSRCVLWDSQTRGFGVRITPSGRKFFIYNYRSKGRSRMITIGDYGPLTLEQARAKANELAADLTLDGTDPLDEKSRESARSTMAALCDDYMRRHANVHKRSAKKDKSRIDRHILPAWKNRQVKSITRIEVAELHRKIGKKTPYEANRILEMLSKMFELAVDWGYLDEMTPNPAKRIEPFREVKRDRWVTPAELPKLAKAIDKEESVYARYALWMYLLTGVRKNELLGVKWSDIDFARKEMRIGQTKSDRVHYVPLSDEALKILEEVPKLKENHYVFCGRRRGKPLVNIDKPWRRVRKEAELEDVRLHDLRRTVGSMLAQSGTSLLVIQKALNHATPAATTVYARLNEDVVRNALESHGKQLVELATKRDRDNEDS